MKGIKDRLNRRRALRNKVLPMAAYYGRDADFERRRGEFYAAMAKAFGWADWNTSATYKDGVGDVLAGRDGHPVKMRLIGKGTAYPINENSNPLEHLAFSNLLATAADSPRAGLSRLEAGLRLRDLISASQISSLKTANLEGASGGMAMGKPPSQHKIEAIHDMIWLRGNIPADDMKLLEDVVFFDVWVWRKVRADRRSAMILRVQRALDLLAVQFRLLTIQEFNARWRAGRRRAAGQGSPDHPQDLQSSPAELPSQSEELQRG